MKKQQKMAEYKCMCCEKILTSDEVHEDVIEGKANAVCESCYAPDWDHNCCNCGATPIVPATGMCGPCTWGDSDTIGGNW